MHQDTEHLNPNSEKLGSDKALCLGGLKHCLMLKHPSLEAADSNRRKESAATKTMLRWAVSTIRLRLDLC